MKPHKPCELGFLVLIMTFEEFIQNSKKVPQLPPYTGTSNTDIAVVYNNETNRLERVIKSKLLDNVKYSLLYLGTVTSATETTTESEILSAINSVGFTINDGEMKFLKVVIKKSGILFSRVYAHQTNKAGNYGTGETVIVSNDIVAITDVPFNVETETTEVIDLGDIGASAIEVYINGTTNSAYNLQSGVIYIFEAVINGEDESYLYVGTQPILLGSGNNTVTEEDFQVLNSDSLSQESSFFAPISPIFTYTRPSQNVQFVGIDRSRETQLIEDEYFDEAELLSRQNEQSEGEKYFVFNNSNWSVYRLDTDNGSQIITDYTVVATYLVDGIIPDGGGQSAPVSKTGNTIVFTEDAFYNEQTFLTSGDLTLDLTNGVKGTYTEVYCNGYAPNINGEYFISSGSFDPNSLNILSFFYDGTRVYLNIANVESLTVPQITSIAQGDGELTVNWGSVPDGDNYVLERSSDNFATAGTEVYSGALLTFTDTGLTNGTSYAYRVKAQGSGFIESGFSTSVSETPSAFSWAARVPAIGYSTRDKLNSSATFAFQVVPNSDGSGTQTDIGFDGELVDFQQILDLPDNDLYIRSWYNQGTTGSANDCTILAGQTCPQIKSGGALVTDPSTGQVASLIASSARYQIPRSEPLFNGTNPLTCVSVTSSTNSAVGTILYTGSGTSSAFDLKHTRTNLDMAIVHDNHEIKQSAILDNSDALILQVRKTPTELFGYNDDNAGSQALAYTDDGGANNIYNLFTANGNLLPFIGYFSQLVIYSSDIGETEMFKIRNYFNSVYNIY